MCGSVEDGKTCDRHSGIGTSSPITTTSFSLSLELKKIVKEGSHCDRRAKRGPHPCGDGGQVMFKFKHKDSTYLIWFHHERWPLAVAQNHGYSSAHCGIVTQASKVVIRLCQARARCSKHDQFNRVTGRRLALARLLKAWTLTEHSKELRRRVWIEYARHHKDGGPILMHNSRWKTVSA